MSKRELKRKVLVKDGVYGLKVTQKQEENHAVEDVTFNGVSSPSALPANEDKQPKEAHIQGASDLSHLVLLFDNNREARAVSGQFDENIRLMESELGIDIRPHGNQLTLLGDENKIKIAQRALNRLLSLSKEGHQPNLSDTIGALTLSDQTNVTGRLKVSAAKVSTRKKVIHARTPNQDAYIRAMDRAELVFGVGPAGTGKTYLAVAHAAQLLERGVVDRIVLSRPAVEAGERLGFLPGDMKDKIDPYLRPLYDALYDMIPSEKVEKGIAAQTIEIAPLAFMRGRTLAHAAIILDEAQNTTSMQMKMFLTRLGEGSRMIITGDPSQIDLPVGQSSGLLEALDILKNIDNIITVKFTEKDVVRHPLVGAIVNAYERARHLK